MQITEVKSQSNPLEKPFHDYERKYALLLGRIWPDQFKERPTRKATHGRGVFKISEKNRKLINKYRIYLENDTNSIARNMRILHLLAVCTEMLGKNYEDARKSDIEALVTCFNTQPTWGSTTVNMHKQTLKMFYKWYKGSLEEFPKIVKWIKVHTAAYTDKLPEDLLTESDVKSIINHCDHPMKRALISMLWETGARIGEIGVLNIRNVAFNGTEANVMLKGKTGMRQVLLVSTVPLLKEWISMHPNRENRDSPLFVITSNYNKGRRLTYDAMRKSIAEATKRESRSVQFVRVSEPLS